MRLRSKGGVIAGIAMTLFGPVISNQRRDLRDHLSRRLLWPALAGVGESNPGTSPDWPRKRWDMSSQSSVTGYPAMSGETVQASGGLQAQVAPHE